MSDLSFPDFDFVYRKILKDLHHSGEQTTNRKGETLTELTNYMFSFTNPLNCIADRRDPSRAYLEGELAWYISGSLDVNDAARLSKFWRKCTDDGCTVNSNYGYLLFHEKGGGGVSQFEHALRCLQNNIRSKKAVMTLYNTRHAYISNDNPCTMFVQLHVNKFNRLNMTVHMRSSDVYFGLPYDVPFFCFVLYAAHRVLVQHHPNLKLGSYTHIAGSLHKYSRNEEALYAMIDKPDLELEGTEAQTSYVTELFERMYLYLSERCPFTDEVYMREAWRASEDSTCLKKKVGSALVDRYGVVHASHGGKEGDPCKFCVREMRDIHEKGGSVSQQFSDLPEQELHDRIFASTDKWHGDECPSVHSEMRLMTNVLKYNVEDDDYLERSTIYVTHGPCDACLKLLDLVGVRNVVWDVPYKTNYKHWPRLNIRRRLSYYDTACQPKEGEPGLPGVYKYTSGPIPLDGDGITFCRENCGTCLSPQGDAFLPHLGASSTQVSALVAELERKLNTPRDVLIGVVRNRRK